MFTDEEITFLRVNYPEKGKIFCCQVMGKTESQIRSMAAKLKLRINRDGDFFKSFQRRAALGKVGKKRPDHSELMKKYAKEGRINTFIFADDSKRKMLSERAKKWYAKNDHPKGMLGKNHSEESKLMMGEASKKMWQNPNITQHSKEYRQGLSDRFSKAMIKRLEENPSNVYSRVKSGKITIEDRTFFVRSSWEANIAAYLQFLKNCNEIIEWEYEPETFWFLEIKRGVRSYKPDFRITDKNGSVYYEEVKGWMDAKSATKLKRMKKYYPKIDVRLLDQKRYKEISKNAKLIPLWGTLL